MESTLGPSEGENVFNFCKHLYIRSPYGVLITKNTKLEKISTFEKMTPKGDPWTTKMLVSQLQSFEPNRPCFFIYILVVYEEYIIKSSNFNIRKISMVIWFLGVIFCISQKLPLGSKARSHFYGTLVGSPERTCHIGTTTCMIFSSAFWQMVWFLFFNLQVKINYFNLFIHWLLSIF